jgi:hypothetical protein
MDLKKHIQDLTLAVTHGTADAAETYALLYGLKKTIEDCMDSVKEQAIEEVRKYGKEGVVMMGLHMTTKAGAGRWNYKTVALHNELSAKIKQIEELAQAAYRTGGNIADIDGVIIEQALYLPGADTVVCTKPKQH